MPFSTLCSRAPWLVVVTAVLTAACGSDGAATPDASQAPIADAGPADAALPAPDATPPEPDAAPVACTAITFSGVASQGTGANLDLFGAGPAAWASNGATGGPPGDLLYVEAYRGLITGEVVTQTEFKNWAQDCNACIFLARECPSYVVETRKNGAPVHPTTCGNLFMLDTGVITLTTFDTSPAAAGTLAGTVTPLEGQTSVRLVQVYKTGPGSTATGFGNRIDGGDCLEVPSLAFEGTWAAPSLPDAGVPAADAGAPDAALPDAATP